ncbi:MAG: hypothetical protein QNK05_07240 [Myxococcota bacterium]|nr:hypothetical protein [Myxococcota bacterium]
MPTPRAKAACDRSARTLPWFLLAAVLLGPLSALAAGASELDADAAEALVRQVYYEGLPEAEARRIGPAGAARLEALLADPTEAAHHANVLLALGHAGQPGAYEAIQAFAAALGDGEMDRDAYRAWQALPYALGALAEHDRRALQPLAAALDGGDVRKRFGRRDGARLGVQRQRAAAQALAASGLPEAGALLGEARRKTRSAELESHLSEALSLHSRRAEERRQ